MVGERKIVVRDGYRSRNKRRYIQESGCYMMLQQQSAVFVPSNCQTASCSKYSWKGAGLRRVIYNPGIRPLGLAISHFCETTYGDYRHVKTRKKVLYFPLAAVLSLDAAMSSCELCHSANWLSGYQVIALAQALALARGTSTFQLLNGPHGGIDGRGVGVQVPEFRWLGYIRTAGNQ